MAEVTNRKINIYIETGAAQQAFDRLNNKAEALQRQLAATTDKGEIRKIKKELDALAGPLDIAKKKLSGEMAPSLKELKKLVTDLGNQMKRMSTTDADFSGVLKQYSQAKAQLQQVQAEVKKVEEAHNGTKGGFLSSFLGNMAANGVTMLVSKIQELASASIKWALETEGVRNAYNRLNQPGLLDNLRKATNGTVTDLELMKRAVAAKNFQIPLETLGTLMEFAKRRANETGQSVDYLVDSIVLGIGRKSPLILDNLGISAARLSEEFKRSGDFGQAAFKIVNDELEKMGPALDTNQDKLDRWMTRFKNFFTDVAQGGISVFENIGVGIRSYFNDMDLIVEQSNQRRAQKNAAAYDFELQMIGTYQSKFTGADKRGRDKIIEQVEAEIKTTTMLRDQALRDGLKDQANQFDRYLDAWGKFLGTLKSQNLSGDTLGGIDQELKLLNEQLQAATIGSQQFKDVQKQIKDLEAKRDNALGKNAQKEANKQESEAERKRKQSIEAQKRDADRLRDELKKIATDLALFDQSEKAKEYQRAVDKYEGLRKLAHGNAEQLKQLDELMQRELVQIELKYARKDLEEYDKRQKEKKDHIEKWQKDIIARAQQNAIQLGAALTAGGDRTNRSNLASLELQVLQSNGRAKLEANKALLHEQMVQELQNTDLTEQEKALIIEKYRRKEMDAERAHWQNVAGLVMEFVGQALAVLDGFNQAKTTRENAELERDKRVNDKKKSNLDKQLKSKQITQQEYDRKVAELDKQQEKKEHATQVKQFKRNQRMSIAQALISGAQGAQKTLAEWGMPLAIPWLALTAAATIAQIAAISAQKPPEMAHGGLLNGPSHGSKTKGMPVINPNTGRTQALLEGGEGITNKRTMSDRSRYTVSGTPSQIISTLNGLHGGVQWDTRAVLRPMWRTTTPQPMNFAGINHAFKTVRMYESGGLYDKEATTTSATDMMTMNQLVDVISTLQQTIAGGIPAFVSLSHFETQQQRKQAIINDATMK